MLPACAFLQLFTGLLHFVDNSIAVGFYADFSQGLESSSSLSPAKSKGRGHDPRPLLCSSVFSF